jgi:hypothetical protein
MAVWSGVLPSVIEMKDMLSFNAYSIFPVDDIPLMLAYIKMASIICAGKCGASTFPKVRKRAVMSSLATNATTYRAKLFS